ncbi:class I SAM-dependent methyltransferase [soil metagenome]
MIYQAARQGFGSGSEAYERGRPSYPPDAVAWLIEGLGIGPGRTVVDLAASTGKLTRLLVPSGARVLAIEPVAAMRDRLAEQVPGVDVREGTAEALGLRDGSVDAVVVGQAFHWFDGAAALAGIHRVLRPGGGLGLVWNVRDLASPLQAAVEEMTEPHRGETPSYATGRWRDAFDTAGIALEQHQEPYEQQVDAEALADRVGSTSFIAVLPDEARLALLERVRALIPAGEVGRLRYTTNAYRCRP